VRGVGIVFKTEPIGRNIIFGGKNSTVHAGRIVLNTLDKIPIVTSTGGPKVSVARNRGSLGKTFQPGRAVLNGCRGAGIFRGYRATGGKSRGSNLGRQGTSMTETHICPFYPEVFSF
jgi:hypothetical protein